MASLTGNLISNSYLGLLKTVGNGPISSSLINITDGAGNASPLNMSSTYISMTGNTEITGSLLVTGVTNHTLIQPDRFTAHNDAEDVGTFMDIYGFELFSGSSYIKLTVDGNNFSGGGPGTALVVSNNLENPIQVIQFQNDGTWVDGTVTITTPLAAKSGSQVTGSLKVSGSITSTSGFTGSLYGTAATASNALLLGGFSASQFAVAGNNVLVGDQYISGSVFTTGSQYLTGSLSIRGTVSLTGTTNFSGSLLSSPTSMFTLPLVASPTPVVGSAYFAGSSLYIWDGATYKTVVLT